MEIFLSKRVMRQVRLSVADAIENGEIDSLREDLVSIVSDDNIEKIERRIDGGNFYEFISEILDEWSGEDFNELLELLEAQLSDADVDLKYAPPSDDDEKEEVVVEEEEEEEEATADDSDDDL
ncbi:MAG: hypothetical protein O7F08_04300 [Deltaproteobacteria bacterium]|nr:hypothetical protein [Deltaproteobacteria bacterium]